MDETQTATAQPMATETLEAGRALYRQGRVAESEAAFKAASLFPASAAEGLYGMGLCHLSGRDHRGAEELFRRSLSADPSYVNSLYQLGVIAEREGRAPEARMS